MLMLLNFSFFLNMDLIFFNCYAFEFFRIFHFFNAFKFFCAQLGRNYTSF